MTAPGLSVVDESALLDLMRRAREARVMANLAYDNWKDAESNYKELDRRADQLWQDADNAARRFINAEHA